MKKANPAAVQGRRKARVAKKPAPAHGGLRALLGILGTRTGDLVTRHDDFLYGWKKREG